LEAEEETSTKALGAFGVQLRAGITGAGMALSMSKTALAEPPEEVATATTA
jgi:hypothetical protein